MVKGYGCGCTLREASSENVSRCHSEEAYDQRPRDVRTSIHGREALCWDGSPSQDRLKSP